MIDQIDAEMVARTRAPQDRAETRWFGFLGEGVAYMEMALEPKIQRIMLRDGPAVLGDPSRWPDQTACLHTTTPRIPALVDEGTFRSVDAEAAARLINGPALTAALWIAAADDPHAVYAKGRRGFPASRGRFAAARELPTGPP